MLSKIAELADDILIGSNVALRAKLAPYVPPSIIPAIQHEKFRRLLRYVAERSPFYRRFHRGMENRPLTDLPVLTKSLLMENFDELVTDRSIRLSDAEAFLASAPGGTR